MDHSGFECEFLSTTNYRWQGFRHNWYEAKEKSIFFHRAEFGAVRCDARRKNRLGVVTNRLGLFLSITYTVNQGSYMLGRLKFKDFSRTFKAMYK